MAVEITDSKRKVFARAAEMIRERGWWAGQKREPDPPSNSVCITIAIQLAGRELNEYWVYCAWTVQNYLGLRTFAELIDWNDSHSEEEVLKVLDDLASAPK